jgi:hypothetical protein
VRDHGKDHEHDCLSSNSTYLRQQELLTHDFTRGPNLPELDTPTFNGLGILHAAGAGEARAGRALGSAQA